MSPVSRGRDAALGDIKSRIADRLRQGIAAGTYGPGDPLPSTNELAADEDAAPMTVRAAYAMLISEGLVISVPRKGFFVRETLAMTWHMNAWQDPRRLEKVPLDGWTADVEAAGFVGRQTIEVRMVTADHCIGGHTLGELLDLPAGEPVAVRGRVRFIGRPENGGTEPESIADSYYPYALIRDTAITRPESVNTAAILTELGAALHHYDDELIPRLATQAEAQQLQLPPSTAVLEIIRSGYTSEGRPVLIQHMIRPGQGSRFIYHVSYPETDER
ncbi:GntR family transcriptional regulator [Actinomadura verrucosospora]